MTIKVQNFYPALNYTVTGTNSSVAQAISQPPNVSGSAGNAGGYTDVQFYNPNAFMAYASWATNGTATASTSGSVPLPPTTTIVYSMGQPATSIAVILGTASSAPIYVSVGDGM